MISFRRNYLSNSRNAFTKVQHFQKKSSGRRFCVAGTLIDGSFLYVLPPKAKSFFFNNKACFIRVFATYLIMLGWETYYYYHETVELPNPRPIQPKKKKVKSGIWATFFPQQLFFRRLESVLYRKQTTRNLTQPNSQLAGLDGYY